jgi:hypothetical protein
MNRKARIINIVVLIATALVACVLCEVYKHDHDVRHFVTTCGAIVAIICTVLFLHGLDCAQRERLNRTGPRSKRKRYLP